MATQDLRMRKDMLAGLSEFVMLRREILSILSGTVCVVGLLTVMLVASLSCS